MAIKWRSKILLAKIESSYGVDPTPTGAANAILATNFTIQPMEGQDLSRDLELAFLGAQPTVPVGLFARIGFRVELRPSGTAGTAPAWGPLLRACGVRETIVASTSVTYAPRTEGHESATIHFWLGGTRMVLLGCRGTCVLRFQAQGIPYLEFTFTGLFAAPSEQSRPTPTLSAFLAPLPVTDARTPTFEIAATPLVMRSCVLDLANQVEPRLLIGSESILIVDRAETLAVTVEAVPLSTFDPFDLSLDQTLVELELVHGTAAGSIATLAVPTAQVQRPTGFEQQQLIAEWPLRLVPLQASGDDQWSLALT